MLTPTVIAVSLTPFVYALKIKMSSAAIADRSLTLKQETQAPMSVAVRNLLLTFALAVASLALAGALAGAQGYEMLIVAMGWPHIILGFLFYFGKVLRGEWHARSTFLLLLLLTLALWTAHYTYTITGFISIYFTYHVFRDEVFIYFQRRARHKLRYAVTVAGFVPFILLMFLVTDPRPQHYRQDLRRVELEASELNQDGWTLIPFKPISYSRGHDFYFYIQSPQKKGASGYNTFATTSETRMDGEVRVADRKWPQASDLVFKPYYANEQRVAPAETIGESEALQVQVSGDYNLGQTFKAEQDNLAGIWIPTRRATDSAQPALFVFHLTPDTSLPLPPLSTLMQVIRFALIFILAALVLWKALPALKRNRTFWLYFFALIVIFALLQKVLRETSGAGYVVPVMFQLVVVFHYWSWYVFSFNKLFAARDAPTIAAAAAPSTSQALYDRMLARLRNVSNFTMIVIALNLISVAGVLWYNNWDGPAALRYVFDYSYFLYFLVFHVTFSFGPKQASRKINSLQPVAASAAAATPT
ncbi:MAG: hypothetical protein QOH63_3146 [Acidobacteriota bacterium]|jgi:hypothetical protein|nr:hypothetical protein [Acidobacteriota bacterium]